MDRSHLKGVEPVSPSNGVDTSRLRSTAGAGSVMPTANGRAETAPLGADALVGLEQIRDILLGAERQESDRRFAELEQRVEAQAVQSELAIQQHMEAFEEQIKEEVRTLGTEITTAQQVSADRLDKLAIELKGSMADLQAQVEELSTRAAAADQDVREQLSQQVAGLSDSIQRNYEELGAAIQHNANQLRSESVNWDGLGTMLGDLANQVSAKRPN